MSGSPKQPWIEFRDVDFSYGPDRPVLSGCSLRLEPGQRLALVGANGSGKTTLLHLIVGLLRPERGVIEIFGKPRAAEADFHEVRRRVGLVFQDADDQLFCPTVAEDVAFGPLNLGKPRDEVQRIVARTLDCLGLAGYERRITYRLSGGEKRLVALATVLAMDPDVLLLDEPAATLDDQAVARLIAVLAALPQALLVVSHQPAFREAVTEGTLRLENGRIEPAG
ncbi:MAG: ABC transporter ATP-binding protein [Thermoguttaceae bacterium]|jgi:cobalt/nickel transport system ATP-binding protein